jgi:hypothetical protein
MKVGLSWRLALILWGVPSLGNQETWVQVLVLPLTISIFLVVLVVPSPTAPLRTCYKSQFQSPPQAH